MKCHATQQTTKWKMKVVFRIVSVWNPALEGYALERAKYIWVDLLVLRVIYYSLPLLWFSKLEVCNFKDVSVILPFQPNAMQVLQLPSQFGLMFPLS